MSTAEKSSKDVVKSTSTTVPNVTLPADGGVKIRCRDNGVKSLECLFTGVQK